MDCYFDPGEQYNNIGLDDQGGMYALTKYIISLGHQDIVFIGDQPELWGVDARRLKGHQEALAGAGISWSDTRYFYIAKDRKRRDQDFEQLTSRIGTASAFMFISDYYAVEAINYFKDHGFSIPQDVSVTGFDDNILSHVVRPRLTTVHQDIAQKAEMAVKGIVDLLMGETEEAVDVRLPTRIIKGKSVRSLKIV